MYGSIITLRLKCLLLLLLIGRLPRNREALQTTSCFGIQKPVMFKNLQMMPSPKCILVKTVADGIYYLILGRESSRAPFSACGWMEEFPEVWVEVTNFLYTNYRVLRNFPHLFLLEMAPPHYFMSFLNFLLNVKVCESKERWCCQWLKMNLCTSHSLRDPCPSVSLWLFQEDCQVRIGPAGPFTLMHKIIEKSLISMGIQMSSHWHHLNFLSPPCSNLLPSPPMYFWKTPKSGLSPHIPAGQASMRSHSILPCSGLSTRNRLTGSSW